MDLGQGNPCASGQGQSSPENHRRRSLVKKILKNSSIPGPKDKKYSKMQLRGGSRESGFKEPYNIYIYIYMNIVYDRSALVKGF